jgi:hypothetical protein
MAKSSDRRRRGNRKLLPDCRFRVTCSPLSAEANDSNIASAQC